MSVDSGQFTILILLDLRATFDTLDETVSLNRLRNCVGIGGTVLNWFSLYLSNRQDKTWVQKCCIMCQMLIYTLIVTSYQCKVIGNDLGFSISMCFSMPCVFTGGVKDQTSLLISGRPDLDS